MNIKADAEKYLKDWQKRLKLLDWNFSLKIHDDPDVFKSFACCHINSNHQFVIMELLEIDKIPQEWHGARDLEVTIVHELLHVRLHYSNSKKANVHEEFAIEVVARALVSARRGLTPEDLV